MICKETHATTGGTLGRNRMITGRVDAKGQMHQKVYDVVCPGDLKPDAKGGLPLAGNTVDAADTILRRPGFIW